MSVVAAAGAVGLTFALSTALHVVTDGREPTPEERVLDSAEYERTFTDN